MKQHAAARPGLSHPCLIGAGLLAGAILVAGCGGQSASGAAGSAAVATVGTETISRGELDSALEAGVGARVLGQLIDDHVVVQAAAAKGLVISDDDIQRELATKEAASPQLAQALAAGGPQADAIKEQTKVALAIPRLLTADVKVSDAELKTWFASYHQYYDVPATIKFGVLVSSQKPRIDILAQELASKSKSFEQLVGEQKQANDPAAKGSLAEMPQAFPVDGLAPQIKALLVPLAPGGTTAPLEMPTQHAWAIFRLIERAPAQLKPLDSIKDQAELDCKLTKVAQQLAAQNPANPTVPALVQRTLAYLHSQGNPDPKLRDALMLMDQDALSKTVQALRDSASVQITDPDFAQVQANYGSASNGAAGGDGSGGAPIPAQ